MKAAERVKAVERAARDELKALPAPLRAVDARRRLCSSWPVGSTATPPIGRPRSSPESSVSDWPTCAVRPASTTRR